MPISQEMGIRALTLWVCLSLPFAWADPPAPCNLLLTGEYQTLFPASAVSARFKVKDDQYLFLRRTSNEHEVILFDFKSKKTKVIKKFSSISHVENKNNQLLISEIEDQDKIRLTFFDREHLSGKSVLLPPGLSAQILSPVRASGTLSVNTYAKRYQINFNTGKIREFDVPVDRPSLVSELEDHLYVLNQTTPGDITFDVMDLNTGRRKKSIPLSGVTFSRSITLREISDHEVYIFFKNPTGSDGESRILNLETGQLQSWDELPQSHTQFYKSENGDTYLVMPGKLLILNQRRAAATEFAVLASSIQSSADHRFHYFITRNNIGNDVKSVLHWVDTETGNIIKVTIPLSDWGAISQFDYSPEKHAITIVTTSAGINIQVLRVDLHDQSIHRAVNGLSFAGATPQLIYLADKDAVLIHGNGQKDARLFQIGKTYKPRSFKPTPAPTSLAEAIQKDDLTAFLNREDWIDEFFNHNHFEKKSEWAIPALYSTLARSENRYHAYRAGFQKHYKKLLETDFDHTPYTYQQLSALSYLSPFLKELPEDESRTLALQLAHSLSLSTSEQFSGILPDKILRIVIQNIRPWFGIPSRHITDIEVTSSRNQHQLLLLSSDPFESNNSLASNNQFNRYGLYSAYSPFAIPQPLPGTVHQRWKTGGLDLDAEIKITQTQSPDDVAPKLIQPNYESLWKDKELAGLVVVGENLKGDQGWVLEEYYHYFQEQGFVFENKKQVKDFHRWVSDEISSGHLDYMVKEAHTDGDDKNLFRYLNQGYLRTGVKKLPNGQRETITLYEATGGASQLFSNNDFGQMIRERAKDKTDFIYLNTSCGGITKVTKEISAARSPHLIDIGSHQMMCTFSNSPQSSIYQALNGIRHHKTFEQMRADVKANPDSDEGQLIFPDSPEFDENVRKHLHMYNFEIRVNNSDGTPYEIDHAPLRR